MGMIALIRLLLAVVTSLFKSRARLVAENAALRQQLILLRRKLPGRAGVTNGDRLFFGWLYRLFPSVTGAMLLGRPETLVRGHRAGFRRHWRWKSRCRLGRPPIDRELRSLTQQMNRKNFLWGAPRIHGELLKLGFHVAQSTVAKYIVKRRGPPSQGWQTFLHTHADSIAAIYLFVVPIVGFRLLYGLVVGRLARRLLVWTNVTATPTAEWVARQITGAFPWDDAPKYLVRDRDGHPIALRSPWHNPYVERRIGSIRRDCLDHIVVMGAAHLRRILRSYGLLQPSSNAPLDGQRLPDPPTPTDARDELFPANSRWSASPLCPDVILGTHKRRSGGNVSLLSLEEVGR